MRVILQKIDLDTCMTAFILGLSESDNLIFLNSDADERDILDPTVYCIEAGGSGLVELNNYDHHNTDKYLPPACVQAYDKIFKVSRELKIDKNLKRVVDYVAMVDECKDMPKIEFPSLSNVFSGMLLLNKDKKDQFIKGLEILKVVIDRDIDPFSTMPLLEDWQIYIKAKEENIKNVEQIIKTAKFYVSNSGLKVAFVESNFIGGIGTLYEKGADIVIMYNPAFNNPPVRKFTIAGNRKKVLHLVEYFNKLEKGWGGLETIIGSPRSGSILDVYDVISLVLNYI